MPAITLDIGDAAELAELPQFVRGRLAADREHLVGRPAYGLSQLRTDLDRFIFLPGGNDGEPHSNPDQQ